MKMKIKVGFWDDWDFLFLIIGMVGVWNVTHNGWALLWAFVASIHVKASKKL